MTAESSTPQDLISWPLFGTPKAKSRPPPLRTSTLMSSAKWRLPRFLTRPTMWLSLGMDMPRSGTSSVSARQALRPTTALSMLWISTKMDSILSLEEKTDKSSSGNILILKILSEFGNSTKKSMTLRLPLKSNGSPLPPTLQFSLSTFTLKTRVRKSLLNYPI